MSDVAPFIMRPGERQLFLDDAGIASAEHLSRTMHKPAKKGAVIRPNVERGEIALQTRSAPAWDPEAGVYKLWMITSSTVHSCTTYAESEDGIHWRKPALRQREVAGSLENNVVTPDSSREWPDNAIENAVYDPDDADPARRFKGFAHCFRREPMVSPDGIRWRLLDVPPVTSQDESNLSYDRTTRTFIATVKQTGPHGRSVFLSTSKDFEHWTEPSLMFHADDLDQSLGRRNIEARFADPALQRPWLDIPATYNVDVYNMGVFRYGGLYVGLPTMYHKTGQVPADWPGFDEWDASPEEMAAYRQSGNWAGFHHVQLACSRDLKTWERLGDRRPFIDLSPLGAGAYDLATIIGPSAPVVHGDELWFYYTGLRQYGGPSPQGGAEQDRAAICLAVLRRDGFVSLDAGEQEGVLLTSPFAWSGGTLHVNVNAPHGQVRVEVLGESEDVIASCDPATGDHTDAEPHWSAEPPALGRTVSLHFSLRNTSLYSWWTEV